MPGPCADPPQLLDVDVDQLSGALSLVAVGRLGWLQAAALAEADPRQPPRDGRERHAEHLGDLRRRHPQAPQRLDRLQAIGRQARGHPPGRGAAIQQPGLPFGSPAGKPLAADRSLMPAASAATISDQSSSSMRLTNSLRLFGQVRALAWSFIRCPP